MDGTSLLRLWHTARHLKPVQLYGRLWFRLVRPQPDLDPPPGLRPLLGSWVAPATRRACLIGPRDFLFFGQTGALDEIAWDGPERKKLWRYNQHYFDDLNAEGTVMRADWHQALLEDWVVHNPPGQGNGWEPYPTSLRIVNWVKWSLAGNKLPAACRHSLTVQARWLTKRLEHHLQGNHLFANAKALVFAGLFFYGPEAGGWLRRGRAILLRQFPEQIRPDGGHFELSTMYHALALEDVLDLINLFTASGTENRLRKEAVAAIPGMLHWLTTMCHPDGQIALFNDAAFGIAPDPATLIAYAERLGFSPPEAPKQLTWLPDCGYVRLSAGPAVLLADLASIGPSYLPGHAHADTLSFEFSFEGQRVIVNSGTSVYGTSPERLRQRGTAAHSTVVVANQNSSEVWGGFRVARRAKIVSARVQSQDNTLMAEAAHDGYCRLKGAPVHHRRWYLSSDFLEVKDHLSTDRQPAEARFHFHPDIEVSQTSAEEGLCVMPDGRQLVWRSPGIEARIEPGTWHPEFGRSFPNACLVLPLKNANSAFRLFWT